MLIVCKFIYFKDKEYYSVCKESASDRERAFFYSAGIVISQLS